MLYVKAMDIVGLYQTVCVCFTDGALLTETRQFDINAVYLLYYLQLNCLLSGGPPWTFPRSSQKAHLPLGGEVWSFPLPAIL